MSLPSFKRLSESSIMLGMQCRRTDGVYGRCFESLAGLKDWNSVEFSEPVSELSPLNWNILHVEHNPSCAFICRSALFRKEYGVGRAYLYLFPYVQFGWVFVSVLCESWIEC